MDCQHWDSSRLPCPSSSTSVIHRCASATDFRVSGCASTLHGLLLPSGFLAVLTPSVIAPSAKPPSPPWPHEPTAPLWASGPWMSPWSVGPFALPVSPRFLLCGSSSVSQSLGSVRTFSQSPTLAPSTMWCLSPLSPLHPCPLPAPHPPPKPPPSIFRCPVLPRGRTFLERGLLSWS